MILVTHTIGFEFTSIISGIIVVAANFIYLKAARPSTPAEFVTNPPETKSDMPAWKAVFTYVLLLVALPTMRFGIAGTWLFKRFCGLDRYNYSWRMLYRFSCTRIYKELP